MKWWERIIIYGFLGFLIIWGIFQIILWKNQDNLNRHFNKVDSLALETYKIEATQRLSTDSLLIEFNKEVLKKIQILYWK